MSAMRSPMVSNRPACRATAARFGRYPNSLAAAKTRSSVAFEAQEFGRLFKMVDAVFTATPAFAATSFNRICFLAISPYTYP